MSALWKKEAWSLMPFALLALMLGLPEVLFELLTHVPFARSLAVQYSEIESGDALWGWLLMFAFAMALSSGLLVREFDSGTIEFLDALPVSRTRVFLVKTTLAVGVAFLWPLSEMGSVVLFHAVSRTSLDPSFHWPLISQELLLMLVQVILLIGIGLVLSFFRRFSWVIAGLLVWGCLLMREYGESSIAELFLPPAELTVANGRMPWGLLAAQSCLAVALLALACLLFNGAGGRLLAGYKLITRAGIGRLLPMTGTVAIVGLGVSVLVWSAFRSDDRDADGDSGRIHFSEPGNARVATDHYTFLYPVRLENVARRFVEGADEVHTRVKEFFGAPPGPAIAVDLTGSHSHFAGQAHWQAIQMNLADESASEDLWRTLAHETTHVFIDRLSDRRLLDAFDSTRFFHEGLATWVEQETWGTPTSRENLRFVAAVLHARGDADFTEMVEGDAFKRRYDSGQIYPLGEVFVEALVERHGRGAPIRILEAFKEDASKRKGLSGLALWYDVFRTAGYGLDGVLEEFDTLLEKEVERGRDVIDRLPRLHGEVSGEDGTIGVRVVDADVPEGWWIVCRLRQNADTPERHYVYGISDDGKNFRVRRDDFSSEAFSYQLGLQTAGRTIYEPWVEAVVGR